MNRTRATRAIAAAAAGLLIAGAVAYAAWTVNGSGSGSASATSVVPLTLTSGTPASPLYPGASGDVDTTLNNSNPFPVHVSSIVLDTTQGSSGFAVDGGHSGCNINTLSFASQTNGGSGWDVPANGSLDVDAGSAISMGSGANDSCQGASFTVYLTASGVSG